MKKTILLLSVLSIFFSNCNKKKQYSKGFEVSSTIEQGEADEEIGINKDSIRFETQPTEVLQTKQINLRLTPLFKVNVDPKTQERYIGSLYTYSEGYDPYYNEENDKPKGPRANVWNGHIIPGFEAGYGFNMVNVSHFDLTTQTRKNFFEKPVLIRTLYYPAYSNDTLNHKPVSRNYYLISAFDEDTNKDGMINPKDLRRLFYFDATAGNKKALLPADYSIYRGDYDDANDYLHVFARKDTNGNGQVEKTEPIHVFWIDMKDPMKSGQIY
jgi:hypothetical protein